MFAHNPVWTLRTSKSSFASKNFMAPIAKENELLTAAPESAVHPSAGASAPSDTAIKQQPVALEVPVSVNGARTVEGSAKREPFSETTKTVLVFGSGAVIRLASSVTPGQLLFLTNEKTKKEVVCQVVKSKNYRNVSGYVELEFTESVVGFWGMRFPGDRIGSAPQSTVTSLPAVGSPVATAVPVTPRPIAPVVVPPPSYGAPKTFESKPATPTVVARDAGPKISESKFVAPPASVIEIPSVPKPEAPISQVPDTPAALMPELPDNAVPLKPVGFVSSTFDLPRTPEARASIFAPPPQASAAPPVVEVTSLSNSSEPSFVVPPPPDPLLPPSEANSQTDALKQQTARLQEQLSSMLFAEKPAEILASPPPPTPAPIDAQSKPFDPFAEILQFANKTVPAPAPVKPAELAKPVPPPAVTSMLDDDQLKIPSWLEPLARNAAAPASPQELIEREQSKRYAEQPSSAEEAATPSFAHLDEGHVPELPAPNFGSELNFEESAMPAESLSRKSGKGVLIGAIAAGVLLLAGGGVWYFRQQPAGTNSNSAVTRPSPSTARPETLPIQNSSVLPANSAPQTVQTPSSAPSNSSLQASSNSSPGSVEPRGASLSPVSGKQNNSNSAGGGTVMSLAASEPVAATPKKPSLGKVRLATPKITKRGSAADNGDSNAGLALGSEEPDSTTVGLGAGLAANTSQPAAPAAALPVGGDVKQAKLLSSVPPSYPTLAKNQHIAGDVRVDALIDASGRVTTMKIVSGPPLLHQAAMDALRQWKYQPATLNGNAVPMHLTVTIQFRLR
jgi:TonB family protein